MGTKKNKQSSAAVNFVLLKSPRKKTNRRSETSWRDDGLLPVSGHTAQNLRPGQGDASGAFCRQDQTQSPGERWWAP